MRRRDVRDSRLRLEQPTGVDVESLLVNRHMHDAQTRGAQTVLHGLISGHLRPRTIAWIGEHLAGELDSLLRARHDDHLIWRAARRAHRRCVLGDCFAQCRQTIARAVTPVVVAGATGLATQQPIPHLAREQIARRQRRFERSSRFRLVVAGITAQRLCALRQSQRYAARLRFRSARRRSGGASRSGSCGTTNVPAPRRRTM